MGFRILILLLISVHAISARPQSEEEESDDAGEEWEVECGLHNKNGIEGGSPEGGLILDFFFTLHRFKSQKKRCQIILLSIFSVVYSAQESFGIYFWRFEPN